MLQLTGFRMKFTECIPYIALNSADWCYDVIIFAVDRLLVFAFSEDPSKRFNIGLRPIRWKNLKNFQSHIISKSTLSISSKFAIRCSKGRKGNNLLEETSRLGCICLLEG